MTLRRVALAVFLSLVTLIFGSAAGSENILIRPGFQQILDVTDGNRISVGDPEIVEAQPLPKGDGIILVGKKEGETDLLVWQKGKRTEWKVQVRYPKASIADEARAFLSSFPDLAVTDTGSSVLIQGTVASPRDKTLIEEYAKTHPGVHLRLSLPEDRKILLSYDLKIIEISKGSSSQVGIRWPDGLVAKGTWSSASGTVSTFSVNTDFEARLNLLLADGKARILANPKLVCESGQSARFLAGGEIPIVIATPETRTVEWKTYGIILSLQPNMDSGGKIRTQITAEISTVDHASGTPGAPGFLTRRVTTFFSTLPGSTVMISGLVRSEMAKDISKLPLLGQIPILGELFKSRNFRENQTELALFITPTESREDDASLAGSWDQRAREEKESMRYKLLD